MKHGSGLGGVCLSVLGCCSGVDGHHFIRRNGRSNWHQMGVCSCGDFIWGYIGVGVEGGEMCSSNNAYCNPRYDVCCVLGDAVWTLSQSN